MRDTSTEAMYSPFLTAALLPLLAAPALGQNFTISNGQIFTPGFAVLDSPQPGTPMGGGMAHTYLAKLPSVQYSTD